MFFPWGPWGSTHQLGNLNLKKLHIFSSPLGLEPGGVETFRGWWFRHSTRSGRLKQSVVGNLHARWPATGDRPPLKMEICHRASSKQKKAEQAMKGMGHSFWFPSTTLPSTKRLWQPTFSGAIAKSNINQMYQKTCMVPSATVNHQKVSRHLGPASTPSD